MKRLSRNFLSIIVSDIVRRVLGFMAVAYLARRVGTEGFGLVNIGFTILSYGILASSAGLITYGTREVARGNTNELAGRIVSVRLFLSIPIFAIIVVASLLVVQDILLARVIICFSLSIFIYALLLDWYFQGKEEMGIAGFGRVASAAIYLLFIIVFVRNVSDSIWVAVGALVGDAFAAMLILTTFRRKFGEIRLRFEPKEWKLLLFKSLPLGAGTIIGSLTVNLAPLAIAVVMTNSDVGIYSAAGKLVFFLLMFDRVFATLLLPATTRLQTDSPEALSAKLTSAAKWIVVGAFPVAMGGMLLSRKIIPLIFGNQYTDAILVFQVLIWYFFFTVLHTVYTSGLIAIGREQAYSKVMMLSALIYAVSIVVLTRLFGILGTAVAMSASEAVTLILMNMQFRKFLTISMMRYILRTVPAVTLMSAGIYLLSSSHLIISVLAGMIVYVAALFVTRALSGDDIHELLERI